VPQQLRAAAAHGKRHDRPVLQGDTAPAATGEENNVHGINVNFQKATHSLAVKLFLFGVTVASCNETK
jgi:hypothetical protein